MLGHVFLLRGRKDRRADDRLTVASTNGRANAPALEALGADPAASARPSPSF
jgi:hypothetical protein